MKKLFFSVFTLIAIAAFAISCSPSPSTSNDAALRTMDVRGVGTVELEPDIARVNIGVRTQSLNVAEALNENNTIAEAIIQSLKDLGVDAQDIQTRNFNVRPERESRPGPENEVIQNFVVENTISAVIRDFDTLGEILTTVIEEGANTIHGVIFDIEDREGAVEQARQLAIQDAQAQAEDIAEAAGINLVAIHTINIGTNGSPAPRAESPMDMAVGGDVPIAGGMLTIRVSANITYEID